MRKRELEMTLQSIRTFEEPDVALEQYMTPAVIAADMLFEAHRKGDIAGLKVVDLGCGTGMLSIGSWFLDAGMVVGYDASEKALETARMNAENLGAEVDFKLSDIHDVTEGADTVVMNPPFGCQRPHADRPFLEKALELSECVYSIHMAESLEFVESFVEKHGRNVDWHRTYGFDIPHMFPFHRKAKQTVEVVAVRIVRGLSQFFIGWLRIRTRSIRTNGSLPECGGLKQVDHMSSDFVMPGDEVAIEEEYAAGEGTFAENGTVYASQMGTLVLDDDECVASVVCPNPPNILHKDDIVYAVVADIRKTMATADVIAKEGTNRNVGGETYATIHVSKISPKYTDNVDGELRKGDYIRARVTETKPSLQLTTKDVHLGCIRALCSKCKTEMVRSKNGSGLFCPECRYAMPRKLADDYGDVKL